MTVKRYTPTQCCEHDGTYVTYSDYQKLVAENAVLKSFGNKLDEMHNDLNGEGTGIQGRAEVTCQQAALEEAMEEFYAIQTPATDAAIAEIESVGAEKMFNLVEPAVRNFCNSLVTVFIIEELESLAANLRAGSNG